MNSVRFAQFSLLRCLAFDGPPIGEQVQLLLIDPVQRFAASMLLGRR